MLAQESLSGLAASYHSAFHRVAGELLLLWLWLLLPLLRLLLPAPLHLLALLHRDVLIALCQRHVATQPIKLELDLCCRLEITLGHRRLKATSKGFHLVVYSLDLAVRIDFEGSDTAALCLLRVCCPLVTLLLDPARNGGMLIAFPPHGLDLGLQGIETSLRHHRFRRC